MVIYQTDKLVGRTEACNYPPASLTSKAIVGGVKPDYEKLKAANPDFIVYDATLYSDADVAKLKETGATLFGITAKNLDQYKVQLFELGNFLGGTSNASDYMDKVFAETAAAQGQAVEPHRKVAVILPGPNGNNMIAGTTGFLASEIKAAGGDPVGPEADRFVPLTPESLVALNPDVIIVPATTAEDTKGALSVLNDSRYKSVKAIKEKRVRAMLSDVLLRTGARVDLCIRGLGRLING